jgi:hypothetical protein
MFNVFNGQGEVVETAQSHTEALNMVTYLSTHDRANGPFHCAPAALVTA